MSPMDYLGQLLGPIALISFLISAHLEIRRRRKERENGSIKIETNQEEQHE